MKTGLYLFYEGKISGHLRNLSEVRDISDHIIVMKAGKKVFDGDNQQFQNLDNNKSFTEIFMEMVDD